MKLTDARSMAMSLLIKNGALRPGERFKAWKAVGLIKALDSLAADGLVDIEETDIGLRYSLTERGMADAR